MWRREKRVSQAEEQQMQSLQGKGICLGCWNNRVKTSVTGTQWSKWIVMGHKVRDVGRTPDHRALFKQWQGVWVLFQGRWETIRVFLSTEMLRCDFYPKQSTLAAMRIEWRGREWKQVNWLGSYYSITDQSIWQLEAQQYAQKRWVDEFRIHFGSKSWYDLLLDIGRREGNEEWILGFWPKQFGASF